jgi:hypothetical protein
LAVELSANADESTFEPFDTPAFFPLGAFRPSNDLRTRLQLNFRRLEEEKYQPENVYQREVEASNWPGDTEGRTVLALILLAQASGRTPRYLDAILARWPREVNERGYFGVVHADDTISEQQLSGHGWALRALAELERWRPGGPARALAEPIVQNLILPTAGAHREYPLDADARMTKGGYSGSHLGRVGRWLLSTDVGCDFICLDGIVDIYDVFRDARLRPIIEEMVARFLQLDLVAVKAQTHATLTACRALLRWAVIAHDESLVHAVVERYDLYSKRAWTEHYANFNWFERPQWTEPCAIVDSLMVVMELWRRTGEVRYVHDAQHIYFNALGHAQRSNGGFGCDNCPGADGEKDLFFKVYEAHWCCTMRGGEGLSRMAQYCVARRKDEWLLPFWLPGEIESDGTRLTVESSYPLEAALTLRVRGGDRSVIRAVGLIVPPWITDVRARGISGEEIVATGSWLHLAVEREDETWTISGKLAESSRPLLNPTAAKKPFAVRYRGPLLLAGRPRGEEMEPLFHAYRSPIVEPADSRRRLLWE